MRDQPDTLEELLAQLSTGALNRRDFLLRATALGITLAAASTLVASVTEASGLTIASAFGATPKVLTSWGFKVVLPNHLKGGTVAWSGTGTFGPLRDHSDGTLAHFTKAGSNTVRVGVTKGGQQHTAELAVIAKDIGRYAKVGSLATAPVDAHGCPACPHTDVFGALLTGTPAVFINNTRLVPVGSTGRHKTCCDENTFVVTGGDSEVKFQGKALAVLGSPTQHCGGKGSITKL
jgi:uncharacterized Zn-binding protein involved in type VI secretion